MRQLNGFVQRLIFLRHWYVSKDISSSYFAKYQWPSALVIWRPTPLIGIGRYRSYSLVQNLGLPAISIFLIAQHFFPDTAVLPHPSAFTSALGAFPQPVDTSPYFGISILGNTPSCLRSQPRLDSHFFVPLIYIFSFPHYPPSLFLHSRCLSSVLIL